MDNLEKKAVKHVLSLLKNVDNQPAYNLVSVSIRQQNDVDKQRSIMNQLSDCNRENVTKHISEAIEWLTELSK